VQHPTVTVSIHFPHAICLLLLVDSGVLLPTLAMLIIENVDINDIYDRFHVVSMIKILNIKEDSMRPFL